MKKKERRCNSAIVLIIVFAFLSCNQSKHKEQTSKKEPVVKMVEQEVVSYNEEELKALADSLELAEDEYNDLLLIKNKVEAKSNLYYRKIHLLQTEVDSLNTLNNALIGQVKDSNAEIIHETPEQEKELMAMVHEMNNSWKNLSISKNKEDLLRYFYPKFFVNQVAIDYQNKGNVAGYTNEDFDKYLEEIIARKGFSYEFGDVTFLDIEVKEGVYFNVTYKCKIRNYQNDKQVWASSVLVTITGKHYENDWKIVNYSIVNFQYN